MNFTPPPNLEYTLSGLSDLLKDPPDRFLLIDVRTDEEFARGHIDGAVHVPLNELATKTEDIPENSIIVTYCAHGVRSKRAKEILTNLGYPYAYYVKGDIERWDDYDLPLSYN